MGLTIPQLPLQTAPQLTDLLALSRPSNFSGGGMDYGVPLTAISSLIGSGGGTGLPTVFQYNQFGAAVQPGTGAANDTAMNLMLAEMFAINPVYGGGSAFIPAGSYLIDAQPGSATEGTGGFLVPSQTTFWSTGASLNTNQSPATAPAPNFQVTTTSSSASNVLFTSNGGSNGSSPGGTVFKNLAIAYTSGAYFDSVALQLNGWGSKADECVFYNCPTAAVVNALHGGLDKCTVAYQVSQSAGPNGGSAPSAAIPMVVLAGNQSYVTQCEMQQNPSSGNGPTGICGILMCNETGTGNGMRVVDNHLSDFYDGVSWAIPYLSAGNLGAGAYQFVHNNHINAGRCCIYMGLEAGKGNNSMSTVKITANTLYQTQAQVPNYANIWIDPGLNGQTISDITISENSIFQNINDGIHINGGSGIKILNNVCSGNGAVNINITSEMQDGTTGAVGNILISNNELNATYSGGNAMPPLTAAIGLKINGPNLGSGSIITVQDNMFLGSFGTAAVQVTGTITTGAKVHFFNNIGYNDQRTQINTVAGIVGATAYAAWNQAGNGAHAGTNYYGPSIVAYTANASGGTLTITNGGSALTLAANQTGFFTLNDAYETFQFSLTPAAIQWTGY